MAHILIIEDEVLLAKSVARSLARAGHECIMSATAEDGLTMLETTPSDVVLLDLQLPGMSGLEALGRIKELDPNTPVIIATAHATMAAAVEAMRAGACDLLRKPLDIEELRLAVERALRDSRMRQTISYYNNIEADRVEQDKLVCRSPAMKEVDRFVNQILGADLASPSDYPPVLILGETGTGKDLVARTIHYHGALAQGPFIEVNCSTLPKGLEEAELFGYERGAFTGADRAKRGLFEAATGGTLFLNEVGDLTAEAQAKLLQAIERKCIRRVGGVRDVDVDVRIVAATNRDLRQSDHFRQDLYFRLHNLTIELPPLRERREDLGELTDMFMLKFGQKYGVEKVLGSDARAAMAKYDWPGNVRELRQLIERVTFLNREREVTAGDMQLPVDPTGPEQLPEETPGTAIDLDLAKAEQRMIVTALEQTRGNVTRAAELLGITREALRYRIHKYDLDSRETG